VKGLGVALSSAARRCTYPVNIMIQRCSDVQLSSAGFSRHPTATTGPISQGGISGHKQEAGLLLEACAGRTFSCLKYE
jgi:hypothetical protein